MRRSMSFKALLICASLAAFALIAGTAAAQDLGGGATVTSSVPAEATQDETPTTPGGEEQPPEEQPDGEQPPSIEPTPDIPEDGAGDGSSGALPQTGWQAFALASIGLGLLLAGAALRPTSSWPPPRDRLSRSPIRR